jgi:cell division protease FtsH
MRKVPIADDVNARVIARGTPGFSGADLANLVNEAALFAARDGVRLVQMEQFEKAKDKVLMGVERRSLVMSEKERKLTAYHEAGHAIVGLSMPSSDPVYKVTIIPRARALGVTLFLPETDRHSYTRQELESRVAMCFGGRVAEELIFGKDEVTVGASDDIKKATEICRNMVTRWGLSERLGPLTYGDEEGEVFLGHSVTKQKEVSDETARTIDEEVKKIVDRNYNIAHEILVKHTDKLHIMADTLLKYETIDAEQIKDIMEGREPREPSNWQDHDDPTNAVKKNIVDEKPSKYNVTPLGDVADEH